MTAQTPDPRATPEGSVLEWTDLEGYFYAIATRRDGDGAAHGWWRSVGRLLGR